MGTLIAHASEGLAKSSMNRRGFLGRLVRATTGAAVLTGLAAVGVSADNHCWGPYFCVTSEWVEDGFCGDPGCFNDHAPRYRVRVGVHCLTQQPCPTEVTHYDCNGPSCPS